MYLLSMVAVTPLGLIREEVQLNNALPGLEQYITLEDAQ
jgi:hypothetical protein